jgi:hypothetical protein
MEPGQKEHPLATGQALAAFATAALFWGVGVTLIDRNRHELPRRQ